MNCVKSGLATIVAGLFLLRGLRGGYAAVWLLLDCGCFASITYKMIVFSGLYVYFCFVVFVGFASDHCSFLPIILRVQFFKAWGCLGR